MGTLSLGGNGLDTGGPVLLSVFTSAFGRSAVVISGAGDAQGVNVHLLVPPDSQLPGLRRGSVTPCAALH